MSDWKDMLIINWSDTEKNIVKQYIQKVEENKTRLCNNPIWHYQFKDIR